MLARARALSSAFPLQNPLSLFTQMLAPLSPSSHVLPCISASLFVGSFSHFVFRGDADFRPLMKKEKKEKKEKEKLMRN